MNETPLFTIIIPHYNRPQLLERCLASIPDIPDIQVIVVDDNSASEIVDFDHFPGSLRANTTIIYNKENKGAGHARNLALPHALGKWLIFADADDYFEPNAFDVFNNHADDTADIIFFGSCSRFSDTNELSNRADYRNILLHKYLENGDEKIRYHSFSPWAKMTRNSFIIENNIHFDEVIYGNDVMFSARTGLLARSISADPSIVYSYSVTRGSLTMQRNAATLRCRYEGILALNQFLRQHKLEQYQMPIGFYIRQACKYGINTLINFIKLGRKYNANFFFGASEWGRNMLSVIYQSFSRNKKMEEYIVK